MEDMDINDEYLRFEHVLKQPLKSYNISQPGSWEELTLIKTEL